MLSLGKSRSRRVLDFRGEVSALSWSDDGRSLAMLIAVDGEEENASDLLVAIDDVTADVAGVHRLVLGKHPAWPRRVPFLCRSCRRE